MVIRFLLVIQAGSNLPYMFFLNLNIESLIALGNIGPALEQHLKQAGEALTVSTHGHIVEQAQQKLHSSRQKYVDALSFTKIGDDAWVISLDPSAMWIEEGIPPGTEMIDWLLGPGRNGKGKGIKTAKDGSRYRSIPLQQNKGPTQSTPKQNSLTDMLKTAMKERKIPYGGIEKDASGKPKVGLLHSFDVSKLANGKTVPKGRSGASMLQGVRVYQKPVKDKQGNTSVKKAIMTFRTVSTKQKGTGAWVHPGVEAKHFLDEAYEWALKQWSEKIVPDLLDKVVGEF